MLPIRTILDPAGYSEYSEYAVTDYSGHSEQAFRAACELARDHGARLIVLHVLHTAEGPRPRGDSWPGGASWSGNDRESPRKELYRLKSPDPAVRLEHRLREGSPAAEILRMADEVQCDLIVVGLHGRMGLDGVPMGRVAEEVLRRARCPVLAVTCREEPAGSTTPRARVGRVRARRGLAIEGELGMSRLCDDVGPCGRDEGLPRPSGRIEP